METKNSNTLSTQTSSVKPQPSPEVAALQREEQVASLMMQARSKMRQGKRDETRAVLQKVFALSPTDAGALELLGDIFLEEGEQEKAIAVLERGKTYHPSHAAFEEKIALAKIDQQEEELFQLRREMAMTQGDTERWRDKKPAMAATLSLILPGAGQAYVERYEAAAVHCGLALGAFLGWFLPLRAAIPVATKADVRSGGIMAPISEGIGNLQGLVKMWFWLMVLVWIGIYLYSAYDAARLANDDATKRRQELGL